MSIEPGPLGRRQFIVTRSPFVPPTGYVHHEIPTGHLYACPALPVQTIQTAHGRVRVLIGIATNGQGGSVGKELSDFDSTSLMDTYRGWSGRWVLIEHDELHLDATGMLSVYRHGDTLASTPAILPNVDTGPPRVKHGLLLNFQPGPTTGIPGVTRVLPSQILSLRDGSLRSRPLPHPSEVESREAPSWIEHVGELLLESVASAAQLGPVVVPLTAGYDSRLLLAACVRLRVRPRLVTQLYPAIRAGDRRLPPLMASRLGLSHSFVARGRRAGRFADLYDRQVAGLVQETDRLFFEYQQYGWLQEGDVLLRGTALQYARDGLHSEMQGATFDPASLAHAFGATAEQREGLARWVEWVRADPQPVSPHDRFCLEQMLASYTAVTETALDLLAPRSVMPGNSIAFQEAALSLPLGWRKASRHHTELVSRWAPAIASIPFNPRRTAREKVRRIPAALARRWHGAAARAATARR